MGKKVEQAAEFPVDSPLNRPNPIAVPYGNSILFIGGEGSSEEENVPQIMQYKIGESSEMDSCVIIDEKLPFPVSKGKSVVLALDPKALQCE